MNSKPILKVTWSLLTIIILKWIAYHYPIIGIVIVCFFQALEKFFADFPRVGSF